MAKDNPIQLPERFPLLGGKAISDIHSRGMHGSKPLDLDKLLGDTGALNQEIVQMPVISGREQSMKEIVTPAQLQEIVRRDAIKRSSGEADAKRAAEIREKNKNNVLTRQMLEVAVQSSVALHEIFHAPPDFEVLPWTVLDDVFYPGAIRHTKILHAITGIPIRTEMLNGENNVFLHEKLNSMFGMNIQGRISHVRLVAPWVSIPRKEWEAEHPVFTPEMIDAYKTEMPERNKFRYYLCTPAQLTEFQNELRSKRMNTPLGGMSYMDVLKTSCLLEAVVVGYSYFLRLVEMLKVPEGAWTGELKVPVNDTISNAIDELIDKHRYYMIKALLHPDQLRDLRVRWGTDYLCMPSDDFWSDRYEELDVVLDKKKKKDQDPKLAQALDDAVKIVRWRLSRDVLSPLTINYITSRLRTLEGFTDTANIPPEVTEERRLRMQREKEVYVVDVGGLRQTLRYMRDEGITYDNHAPDFYRAKQLEEFIAEFLPGLLEEEKPESGLSYPAQLHTRVLPARAILRLCQAIVKESSTFQVLFSLEDDEALGSKDYTADELSAFLEERSRLYLENSRDVHLLKPFRVKFPKGDTEVGYVMSDLKEDPEGLVTLRSQLMELHTYAPIKLEHLIRNAASCKEVPQGYMSLSEITSLLHIGEEVALRILSEQRVLAHRTALVEAHGKIQKDKAAEEFAELPAVEQFYARHFLNGSFKREPVVGEIEKRSIYLRTDVDNMLAAQFVTAAQAGAVLFGDGIVLDADTMRKANERCNNHYTLPRQFRLNGTREMTRYYMLELNAFRTTIHEASAAQSDKADSRLPHAMPWMFELYHRMGATFPRVDKKVDVGGR